MVQAQQPISLPAYAPSAGKYGFLYISGDDTDHHVANENQPQLDASMTRFMQLCLDLSGVTSATTDILALGIQALGVTAPDGTGLNGCNNNADSAIPGYSGTDAYLAFTSWASSLYVNGRLATYQIVTDAADLYTINFADYRMIYLPSQKAVAQCSNFTYTLCDIETALLYRVNDIVDYVNNKRGSIFALEQSIDP